MRTNRIGITLSAVVLAVLLCACAQTTVSDSSEITTAPATPEIQTQESAAPEPNPISDISRGKLSDRNGLALDESLYPGLDGVEKAFDAYLIEGNAVSLTIDLGLQTRIQEILQEQLGAAGGAAVVVRVETGEPLAIVTNGKGENRALNTTYQPRQLFQPCTGIAALSRNIVTPESLIKCEGVFERYIDMGIAPECRLWNALPNTHYTHPEENIVTALRDSCDYFFYSIGNNMGIDCLTEYSDALGFGQATGIELAESTGIMDRRISPEGEKRNWTIGDTIEVADGRGRTAFTPLQCAEYCAAIANSGVRYSASLLSTVTAENGAVLYRRTTEELSNILSSNDQKLAELLESWNTEVLEANWDAVRQGMHEKLYNNINGLNCGIWSGSGLDIAGEIACGDDYCLFMGYSSFDDPQVAVVVTVEQPDAASLIQLTALEIFNAYRQLNP